MASNMRMIGVALIFSFSACCEGFATSVPLLRKIGSADRCGTRGGGVRLSMMRHEGVHRKKVISAGIATVAGLLAPHGVQAAENSAQWAVHEGPFADSEFSSFSQTPSGLRWDVTSTQSATSFWHVTYSCMKNSSYARECSYHDVGKQAQAAILALPPHI